MRIDRAFTVLLITCFVAACGGGETRWAGTITDSAGVTIVSNTGVGIWTPGEEWTFEEELRIGDVEGAPEYQFGQVFRIAVDSKGRIIVLDGQAQHIKVFSPDGAYEQTIGAPGQGPGELGAGMAVLIGAGDTLLVPDGRNLRFNRYAPDGSSAGSTRMVLEEGRPMTFKGTASGAIAEQIRPLMPPGQPAIENPMDAIVLLATDGTVSDTLITFPSGELVSSSGVTVYASEPAWDLTDEGQLVFGVSDEYRIGLYSGGQLERVISKPFVRRPVGDQDEEAIMGEMERRWVDAGISAEMMGRVRNRFRFADFFPAFQTVAVGLRGTIWVKHVKPASELSANELERYHEWPGREWDVFDSQGRYLGVATMPERFNPMVFRGDKIYGAWRDELDVEYVVVLRIVGDLAPGAT
jgi:hypothetical protein